MSLLRNCCRKVIVALGSNFEPKKNMASAFSLLEREFGPLQRSQTYKNEAIDLEGSPDFLNALVIFDTNLEYDCLAARLRWIETQCGRDRKKKKEIAMDIDILLYDGMRYHEADWQRPYIKTLLCEVLGHEGTEEKVCNA